MSDHVMGLNKFRLQRVHRKALHYCNKTIMKKVSETRLEHAIAKMAWETADVDPNVPEWRMQVFKEKLEKASEAHDIYEEQTDALAREATKNWKEGTLISVYAHTKQAHVLGIVIKTCADYVKMSTNLGHTLDVHKKYANSVNCLCVGEDLEVKLGQIVGYTSSKSETPIRCQVIQLHDDKDEKCLMLRDEHLREFEVDESILSKLPYGDHVSKYFERPYHAQDIVQGWYLHDGKKSWWSMRVKRIDEKDDKKNLILVNCKDPKDTDDCDMQSMHIRRMRFPNCAGQLLKVKHGDKGKRKARTESDEGVSSMSSSVCDSDGPLSSDSEDEGVANHASKKDGKREREEERGQEGGARGEGGSARSTRHTGGMDADFSSVSWLAPTGTSRHHGNRKDDAVQVSDCEVGQNKLITSGTWRQVRHGMCICNGVRDMHITH